MRGATGIRVEDRPERPLVVFDGDRAFCRQWVERWRRMTGDLVEYRDDREVAGRFPEVGGGFGDRIWLIEPDGRVFNGAAAVFQIYALAGESRWPAWLYGHLPVLVAAPAETAYDLMARHCAVVSVAAGWLWGSIDRRPTYQRTREVFLRALGAVYVAAFWSLAVQADGLIGSRGIAPAAEFLDRAGDALGGQRFWQLPTLLWLDASDVTLHLLCWGGVAAGLLLVAGVAPGPCLVLLWLSYLSVVSVGEPFLSYQWDALLLESGLLGILLAPWGLFLHRARRGPPALAVWLVRWLLFRLMFLAGVVKLASRDPTWAAWRALEYHYETQPLPAWSSWYMHQLPAWFQSVSVGFMFWAELVAPFLIFGPRRLRMLSFWSLVLLQVLIAATGNYGFFNLLSIVLCLLLVEDRDWGRAAVDGAPEGPRPSWGRGLLGASAAVIIAVTSMEALDRSGFSVIYPAPLEAVRASVEPFHSMNAYGLFAVMTTARPEVLVEGSRDGEHWIPYTFRWKPGDPDRRPRFATPHMPRLDWQMWFAALHEDCRSLPWFLAFERRLLEGSPEVLGLLASNPFPDKPPRYLRARLFLYHFTGFGEKAWWRRVEAGPFCPPVSL